MDNAVWELTLKCNAKCIHCGSTAGKSRQDDLSYEQAVSVIHQLKEANCQLLTLIGGEYFLYPKWRDLLREIKKVQMKFGIVTNGLMLTNEYLKFLMDMGIYGIGVSLDGSNPKTHDYIRGVPGCFNRAFDAVKRSRALKIPTTVITTINRLNIAELKDLRNKLVENKMRSWQLQHTNLLGRMQKELCLDDFGFYIVGLFCAQSMRLYPKNELDLHAMHCMGYYSKTIPCHVPNRFWKGCFAGRRILGIRSNGDVLGCLSIYDDNFIEGNLKKNTLAEIRGNKKFCQWNHRLDRYTSLTGFCKDCPYGLICIGGCASFSENQKHCYYAIECKYAHLKPNNELDRLFQEITQGHMNKTGRFYLKNGQAVTSDYIASLDIDPEHKKQLEIIALD